MVVLSSYYRLCVKLHRNKQSELTLMNPELLEAPDSLAGLVSVLMQTDRVLF